MKYLIIYLFTMGKDPPLWGSSMCSGSKAHLSNSTCFFCFRFASRCKITSHQQTKEKAGSLRSPIDGIKRPVHLSGKRSWRERIPREQRRQRRCRPSTNKQSNDFLENLDFRGKVSLPQSTHQLPWYRRQGAGNCWWMPAGEKCLMVWGWCEMLL